MDTLEEYQTPGPVSGCGARGWRTLEEIPNVDDGVTAAAKHHDMCVPM